MIQSMTGFGKSLLQLADKKIIIEIKSLNSKAIDLNTRIAQAYKEKELTLRKLISDTLERGKIDFTLTVENTSASSTSTLNAPVVRGYIEQMRAISPNGPDVEFLKMAVRMPDALTTPVEEVDEREFAQIEEQLVLALKQLQAFRSSEGAILQKDFELRIRNIQQLLTQVEALDTERLAAIRSRMERAVEEIRDRVDENRFEQELIFYLEKLDITEEKVRLANHLNYFLTTLEEPQSNGRKLGFIAQEIGREINTLGSKANHAQMQQIVVLMKNELEKIKEQVLNIL
ncbi:TIGR00255 family protein [Capnocytophaga granulosa]|uniref:TIGR00255 family protein n=1 Tax=Capnocytophaga granulosa TaxID=45242 RepID=A0A1H2R0R7_9FLAO|nr:YicC/YloC family endoribonuclease [Capnocytophaga granulosa]EPD29880.1 TIGR00255 family protein [Capnocytophaga granulosa ATCC 51502]SDW12464.1 TIGR00255 family protein [Capnocytophaga granulosa]SUX21645.1 YicC-like family, N-terminal region [Capnocytophaga granulosa]